MHPAATHLRVDLLMGSPVLHFRSPGGETSGIFDSGAKICYTRKVHVRGLTAVDRTRDFHVLTGPCETDVYQVPLEVEGHRFTSRVGVLPPDLTQLLGRATD
jgi:hypothetical protein